MLWRQMRGSIPTFWSQDTSMITPKPPIVLSRWAHTNPLADLHPHPSSSRGPLHRSRWILRTLLNHLLIASQVVLCVP